MQRQLMDGSIAASRELNRPAALERYVVVLNQLLSAGAQTWKPNATHVTDFVGTDSSLPPSFTLMWHLSSDVFVRLSYPPQQPTPGTRWCLP